MICPHCGETIREEDHYLMSTRSDVEWPRWAWPAIWVLLFLLLTATLVMLRGLGG